MHAIVLDGEVKSALSAVRSISRSGGRVTCGSSRFLAMSRFSRATRHFFIYPSPLEDPDAFIDRLLALCEHLSDPPVLLSFSDATMLTLSKNRERLAGKARLLLPSFQSVEIASHKGRTIALAESLSIPVPETISLESEADIAAELSALTPFPVVVKPRHSVSWKGRGGTAGSASFVFSLKEAEEKVRAIRDAFGEYPLLERYIRGGEYGFEALCHEGKVLMYVAHKRIRSLSPTGGAAVVKETIEPPEVLKNASEKLLNELRWEGPAMVEFKQDETTGVYYLLEINGRFWGSLPLAISAGADFPTAFVHLAMGMLPQKVHGEFLRGIRSRHFLGDMRHLLRVLFANDRMRSIAYPKRREALTAFFSSSKGVRYDVFDERDPLPFFAECIDRLF